MGRQADFLGELLILLMNAPCCCCYPRAASAASTWSSFNKAEKEEREQLLISTYLRTYLRTSLCFDSKYAHITLLDSLHTSRGMNFFFYFFFSSQKSWLTTDLPLPLLSFFLLNGVVATVAPRSLALYSYVRTYVVRSRQQRSQ